MSPVRSPSLSVRGSRRDVWRMVPPARSMPRTPSRVRPIEWAAMLAGSPGSIRITPSQPRRNPITSQPSASAESTTERMQALRPGTSPPPVNIPIRIPPPIDNKIWSRSGNRPEAEAERAAAARHVHLRAVERDPPPRLQLAHRRRDRPSIDDPALPVLQFGADLRNVLDLVARIADLAMDGEQFVAALQPPTVRLAMNVERVHGPHRDAEGLAEVGQA